VEILRAGLPTSLLGLVREPFRGAVGRRLIAVYEADVTARYGRKDFKTRVRRSRFPLGEQG